MCIYFNKSIAWSNVIFINLVLIHIIIIEENLPLSLWREEFDIIQGGMLLPWRLYSMAKHHVTSVYLCRMFKWLICYTAVYISGRMTYRTQMRQQYVTEETGTCTMVCKIMVTEQNQHGTGIHHRCRLL